MTTKYANANTPFGAIPIHHGTWRRHRDGTWMVSIKFDGRRPMKDDLVEVMSKDGRVHEKRLSEYGFHDNLWYVVSNNDGFYDDHDFDDAHYWAFEPQF